VKKEEPPDVVVDRESKVVASESGQTSSSGKRPRGRPLGSKNKHPRVVVPSSSSKKENSKSFIAKSGNALNKDRPAPLVSASSPPSLFIHGPTVEDLPVGGPHDVDPTVEVTPSLSAFAASALAVERPKKGCGGGHRRGVNKDNERQLGALRGNKAGGGSAGYGQGFIVGSSNPLLSPGPTMTNSGGSFDHASGDTPFAQEKMTRAGRKRFNACRSV
jgi:hypothetical protein